MWQGRQTVLPLLSAKYSKNADKTPMRFLALSLSVVKPANSSEELILPAIIVCWRALGAEPVLFRQLRTFCSTMVAEMAFWWARLKIMPIALHRCEVPPLMKRKRADETYLSDDDCLSFRRKSLSHYNNKKPTSIFGHSFVYWGLVSFDSSQIKDFLWRSSGERLRIIPSNSVIYLGEKP